MAAEMTPYRQVPEKATPTNDDDIHARWKLDIVAGNVRADLDVWELGCRFCERQQVLADAGRPAGGRSEIERCDSRVHLC